MSLQKSSTWTLKGHDLQIRTSGEYVALIIAGKTVAEVHYKFAEALADAFNSAHDEIQNEIDNQEFNN